MYKCSFCKSKTAPREAMKRITSYREVTYPERWNGNEKIDSGGTGEEVVQEYPVCEQCHKTYYKERVKLPKVKKVKLQTYSEIEKFAEYYGD